MKTRKESSDTLIVKADQYANRSLLRKAQFVLQEGESAIGTIQTDHAKGADFGAIQEQVL